MTSSQPKLADNDHLIFSKGHASPLLYALYKAAGAITDEELMTYRTHGSRLQGHPTPIIPWVDVATGSLGQGIAIAVGVALAGKYLDKLPFHVWVLCGDSELAEGSVWEALDKAGHYGLSNLTAIFDVNRLGQRGPTEYEWDLDIYKHRVEAFGCRPIVIDGHDLHEIDDAFTSARADGDRPDRDHRPHHQGQGLQGDREQGRLARQGAASGSRREGDRRAGRRFATCASTCGPPTAPSSASASGTDKPVTLPTYAIGDKVATRKAYGDTLQALGARHDVVALDGEVSNSTHADEFKAAYPDRFFEMFIAEQQMVASAVGLSVRGYIPFASTFAAFFSRAYDFIRMAGVSEVSIRLSGSHAGCEIGADGPSQMALEDIASLRAVHTSTVLYPSDAVSAAKLVAQMADLRRHQLHPHHARRVSRCSTTTTRSSRSAGPRCCAAAMRTP